jgi:hypothetical protein
MEEGLEPAPYLIRGEEVKKAEGHGIPLLGLGLSLVLGLTDHLDPCAQERSPDLLKIRLCVIKNDRCCLAYRIGFYAFYAGNPRHGNPYRGGCIPSDAPRDFDNHSSLSGKHVVVDPKQQCRNSHRCHRYHDPPFHGHPPLLFLTYYNRKENKVQNIFASFLSV